MNTAHFPPSCTVITPLLTGGLLSVFAEARTPGRREIELQCNGIKLSRQQWETVITTLLAARLALDVPPHPYALNLTLSGPGNSTTNDPEQLQSIVMAAVLVDRAMQRHWNKGPILTLGRCHLGDGQIRIEPLSDTAQASGLQVLANLSVESPYLLLPAPKSAAQETLLEMIRARHPGAAELCSDEILGCSAAFSPDSWQRSISTYFPVVDLATPNPANDCLLELKVRVAAVDDAKDSNITVHGGPSQLRESIIALVKAFRTRDNPGNCHWKTWISLPEHEFTGHSFELALLVADQIARGREFPMPHGKRLIATGRLSRDEPLNETMHGGTFGSVFLPTATLARKCDLFRREARPGERILLPGNWLAENTLTVCRTQLRATSISMAPINTLLPSPPRN